MSPDLILGATNSMMTTLVGFYVVASASSAPLLAGLLLVTLGRLRSTQGSGNAQ